jgi:hypothetical protein
MELLTVITIASEVTKIAAAMIQDGRQQATAQEVAQIRAVTQTDIGVIEQDAGVAAQPTTPVTTPNASAD